MSKKQDLIVVFEFIAEFLREQEEPVKVIETPKVEEPVEPKLKEEKLFNPEDVKDLMQRVETIDRSSFLSNPILGDQHRNFEQEFKKMVSQVDELTKDKEQKEIDAEQNRVAKSDFNVIKSLRNVSDTERDEFLTTKRATFTNALGDRLKSIRNNDNISFSG